MTGHAPARPARTGCSSGTATRQTDFLYRDELTEMNESGVLTQLDLAFSRDQEEKVYVQDRMRAHAAEIWA